MGALKSIATIATMVVALIIVAAVGWIWWSNHAAKNLAVKEETKAAVATVDAAQTKAAAEAQQIVVAGETRNHVDLTIHQENANAIAAAPGASDALPADVVRAARLGLCRHPAYAADPGCAGLRPSDPAVVPPADPAGAADQP